MGFLHPSNPLASSILLMTLTTAAIVLHTASDTIKLALTCRIIDRHMARMSAQMGGRVIPLLADDGQYLGKNAHLGLIEVGAKEPEVDNLGN